jgi:formate hydrogenlyase subunit 3/multisubunit Na+/H+ antiporter MnhD subunit
VNLFGLPGPVFFFLFLLLLGALSYILNRWTLLSGGLAAGGSLLLAWIALRRLGIDSELLSLPSQALPFLEQGTTLAPRFELLGRTWALTESSLAGLGLIYSLGGLCFLLALPTPHGWAFYPFGLATLGALTLSITAQQFVYALLFIWLAGCLAVFVLAGGRPGDTTAALRTLVFTSLGVMPLLLLPRYLAPDAAGYVGASGTAVLTQSGNLGQTATLLMTAGIAILLMAVPFHGQLVAMGTHAAPMALPFMLAVLPTAVLHTCFRLWEAHPILLSGQFAFDVCRWTGIAAAAWGGLGALGARKWGALVGYATLVDWGGGLVALGLGTRTGADWTAQMLVWRGFSLLLASTGWGALYKAAGQDDSLEQCVEPARRHPLSVLALTLGLLSLAGFPLSPGGMGRWSLLGHGLLSQPVAEWPVATLVLVLSGASVSLGTVIALSKCILRPTDTDQGRTTGDAAEPQVAASDTDGNQRALQHTPDDSADDQAPPQASATGPGGRRERRKRMLGALLGAATSLLALWLIGAFFLQPSPWLDIARHLAGELTFPGG